MAAPSSTRRDVQWPKDAFGNAQPAWSSEPSPALLEDIARKYLNVPSEVPCTISLFAQGAFNKLYTIDALERAYIIRVALPVEPSLKTLSEVATIDFVRAHGTTLVPHVLAHEADANANGLGFEWMLMEKIPGDVLETHWRYIDWEAKVSLVKTVAGVLGRLYDHPLSGIGNIFPDSSTAPTPGRIVSMQFFWDDHYEQDVPRGPFPSSHDWLSSCLQFILNDAAKVLARPVVEDDSDDEDEREEAIGTQAVAEALVQLLPRVFPPSVTPEPTVVHHDDISFHNLLVSSTGQLTGIIDWECVSALPLWRACTFPSFLQSRTRVERPDPSNYSYAQDAEDDSKPNELYLEHLLDWELTQLRNVFLEEMERVQPDWVRVYRSGANVLKNDFYLAMKHCDSEFSRRKIAEWFERVEAIPDEALGSGTLELGEGYKSLYDLFVN